MVPRRTKNKTEGEQTLKDTSARHARTFQWKKKHDGPPKQARLLSCHSKDQRMLQELYRRQENRCILALWSRLVAIDRGAKPAWLGVAQQEHVQTVALTQVTRQDNVDSDNRQNQPFKMTAPLTAVFSWKSSILVTNVWRVYRELRPTQKPSTGK